MSRDTQMNELGVFLKARRAELTPRGVGLPDTACPLYADWETVAKTAVAQLRMEAAIFADDPRGPHSSASSPSRTHISVTGGPRAMSRAFRSAPRR